MIPHGDIAALIGTLTPQQWMEVIDGREGGLLPPCCANLSSVRDRMVTLLLAGEHGFTEAISLGQQFIAEGDAHFDPTNGHWAPLIEMRTLLFEMLDEHEPGWRDIDLAARATDLDEFLLKLELAGDSHAPDPPPGGPFVYGRWRQAFEAAAEALNALGLVDDPDAEYLIAYRELCNKLRTAGAPRECPLFRSFAYSRRRTLTAEDLVQIRKGICPKRVNGTFASGPGLPFSELDLSERADSEAGVVLATAIVEWMDRYPERSRP